MAGRGRPRTFDRTTALRAAMVVFWEHGYEGASMSDLCAAMGINSPSLYAAFTSKEHLFREAVAYYGETEGAAAASALREGPTARESVAAMLRAHVEDYTHPDKPRGCMIVLSATTYTDTSAGIRDHLAELRRQTEAGLRARIERGIADGDVPATADPVAVAGFYNALTEGMSLQARDGATREHLTLVAERGIAAWDAVT